MAEERADHRLFSIVIPTYNEVGNVGAMVSELGRRYPGVKVIIVDDNSQDGTVQAVEALLGSNPGLKLIRRDPADRGLTASVMDGIMSVGTERFVVMDCDFQHPPVYVGQLMKATDSADLVVAAREGMGPLSLGRRVASSGAHKLASFYLWFRRRPRSSDLMSGFFAGRTALAKSIITEHGDKFERRGFKVLLDLLRFMPRDAVVIDSRYRFGDRASGSSKLNADIVLSVLRQCGLGGKVASGTLHFFWINKAGRAVGFVLLAAIFAIVISIAA
jgi:dolichol-phosphate mannosyltransferase